METSFFFFSFCFKYNVVKKIDRLNYKAQAHKIGISVLIGKTGLSEKVIDEINTQLKSPQAH